MRVKLLFLLLLAGATSRVPSCPEKCDCHFNIKGSFLSFESERRFVINCTSTSLSELPSKRFNAIVTVLDWSNNLLTVLKNNTFGGLHDVEELYLRNNSIVKIETGAFRKLRQLRILDLSHNKISSVHSMMFSDNVWLESIDLSYNPLSLDSYEGYLFRKNLTLMYYYSSYMEHSAKLYLRGCNFSVLPQSVYTLMNETSLLDLSFNAIKIVNMSLFNKTAETLYEQRYLFIRNNTVDISLMCNKYDFIKGIAGLHFSGSPLNLTYCQALPQMPKLRDFDMSSCDLYEIPNSFFKAITTVEEINLSSNHLKVVDKSLFSGLDRLNRLSLENNDIVLIDSEAFLKTYISILLLNNNPIALSENESFIISQATDILEVSACAITYLTNKTFQNMSGILYLDLSYNNIEILTEDVFSHLSQVSVLNISHNQIRTIDKHTFLHNRYLSELVLSGNPLIVPSDVPLITAPNLHILKLSSCNISHLPTSVFKHTLQLRQIDLSNNNLKYLNVSVLSKIKGLTSLNILGNPIVCEFRLRPVWLHCLERYINCRARCATPNDSWNILEDVTPGSVTMEPTMTQVLMSASSGASLRTTTQGLPLPFVEVLGSSSASSVGHEVKEASVGSSVAVLLVIGLFVGTVAGIVTGYFWLEKYTKRRSQYTAVTPTSSFSLEELSLEN